MLFHVCHTCHPSMSLFIFLPLMSRGLAVVLTPKSLQAWQEEEQAGPERMEAEAQEKDGRRNEEEAEQKKRELEKQQVVRM